MAKILIADDDTATLDLFRRTLEADGHQVTVVADGSDALDKLGTASPAFALLITDVQMPGIDGIELARQALAAAPALRVLLMSGYPEQLDRASGLGSKHVRTLGKPFTLEKARSEVKAALA